MWGIAQVTEYWPIQSSEHWPFQWTPVVVDWTTFAARCIHAPTDCWWFFDLLHIFGRSASFFSFRWNFWSIQPTGELPRFAFHVAKVPVGFTRLLFILQIQKFGATLLALSISCWVFLYQNSMRRYCWNLIGTC